jgi:hypothetical protein
MREHNQVMSHLRVEHVEVFLTCSLYDENQLPSMQLFCLCLRR